VGATLANEFAYNGDGVRTRKTVAGDAMEYVLDLAATLPVVISDTEAVYLYGLDIIAQQQAERLYYVHDGLGSVRQLVDTTAQIETNYAYDPFGVPLLGGEVYNPFQYTGEAWDAEVGLLYLRARYYQPEVGRFITKDPWAGDSDRPATLNSYAYGLNNAVNLMDRSGYEACMDIHCEAPIVDPNLKSKADRLEQDYGILVGRRQMSRGMAGVRSGFQG
jgi:RHS repeat-associated protein